MRTMRGAIFALFSLGLALCSLGLGPASASARAAGPAPTVLWSFCSAVFCTDGKHPTSGVTVDPSGNAIGTTAGDLYTDAAGAPSGSTLFAIGPSVSTLYHSPYYRMVNFCSNYNCADGAQAGSNIISAGTKIALAAIGTTARGGANNGGAIYRGTPDFTIKQPVPTVLYSFCGKTDSYSTCADGSYPRDIVTDATGNIYGTTRYGGLNAVSKAAKMPNGAGVLYKLDTGGRLTVLHSFCSETGCVDGALPFGRQIVLDRDRNTLYGTTYQGGAKGTGVIFSYNLGTNQFAIVHNFCDGVLCLEGQNPQAGLTMGPTTHALYGAAQYGGQNGRGVIYRMDSVYRAIYIFCATSSSTCPDGAHPGWAPTPDGAGNLVGTTPEGGAKNAGVLYKLSNSSTAKPTMQTLYTFCSQTDCADGANPSGPLTLFPGNKIGTEIQWTTIYGTTANGGAHSNAGTVFSFPK